MFKNDVSKNKFFVKFIRVEIILCIVITLPLIITGFFCFCIGGVGFGLSVYLLFYVFQRTFPDESKITKVRLSDNEIMLKCILSLVLASILDSILTAFFRFIYFCGLYILSGHMWVVSWVRPFGAPPCHNYHLFALPDFATWDDVILYLSWWV